MISDYRKFSRVVDTLEQSSVQYSNTGKHLDNKFKTKVSCKSISLTEFIIEHSMAVTIPPSEVFTALLVKILSLALLNIACHTIPRFVGHGMENIAPIYRRLIRIPLALRREAFLWKIRDMVLWSEFLVLHRPTFTCHPTYISNFASVRQHTSFISLISASDKTHSLLQIG